MIQTEDTTETKTVVKYPRKSVCALLMNQVSVAVTVQAGMSTVRTNVTGMFIQKKLRRIFNE